jgi:hypothetical protein
MNTYLLTWVVPAAKNGLRFGGNGRNRTNRGAVSAVCTGTGIDDVWRAFGDGSDRTFAYAAAAAGAFFGNSMCHFFLLKLKYICMVKLFKNGADARE